MRGGILAGWGGGATYRRERGGGGGGLHTVERGGALFCVSSCVGC